MKNIIIDASIELLQSEGLKFSIDMLAKKLKISKKTIYKYFIDKGSLAIALYETYYLEAINKAIKIINENEGIIKLLTLYYDSKKMVRDNIFNKYKLNDTIHNYALEQNNKLWNIIRKEFNYGNDIRYIIDGSFEKMINENVNNKTINNVIERIAELL